MRPIDWGRFHHSTLSRSHYTDPGLRISIGYSTSSSQSPCASLHSAFALAPILCLKSCRFMGGLIITPLPPLSSEELLAAGPLCSKSITSSHCSYGPIRRPPISCPFPWCCQVIGPVFLRGFLPGMGRASPVASHFLCPSCRRCYPAGMCRRTCQTLLYTYSLRHGMKGSASGVITFEATSTFTFITARGLAHHPFDGFMTSFRWLVVPSTCRHCYMLSGFWHGRSFLLLDVRAFSGRTIPNI